MRYRWSRKPPATFISSIFSAPLLTVSPRTSHRGGMQTTQSHGSDDVTTYERHSSRAKQKRSSGLCRPRATYSIAHATCRRRLIRMGSCTPTTPQAGVDSGREPDGRPHAPRRDPGGSWDWHLGTGRPAAPVAARALLGFRGGVRWCPLRLRGTRRRGRCGTSGRVVRNRDGGHGRRGRHRGSVRRTESQDGIAAPGHEFAWR
jgi:hypothetical protein